MAHRTRRFWSDHEKRRIVAQGGTPPRRTGRTTVRWIDVGAVAYIGLDMTERTRAAWMGKGALVEKLGDEQP